MRNFSVIMRNIKKFKNFLFYVIMSSIKLILVLIFFTYSYGYDPYYNDNYNQNNYNRYSYNNFNNYNLFSYNNFKPSTLGLYSFDSKSMFENNPMYSSKLNMWSMNNEYSENISKYVAPTINISDYAGYDLRIKSTQNTFTWENYSNTSDMYEPVAFSNFKLDNNKLQSFDMMTARDNWMIRQSVEDITYNSNNLPSSLSLITFDMGNNSFIQEMSNIKYTSKNLDQNRFDNLLNLCDTRMNQEGFYGFGQLFGALQEHSKPASQLPTSFDLKVTDPRGNITNLSFSNIIYKNEKIMSFSSIISQQGKQTIQMQVGSILNDQGRVLGYNIDITRSMSFQSSHEEELFMSFPRKWESRGNVGINENASLKEIVVWNKNTNVPLNKFVEEKTGLKVNPLNIMGSTKIQLNKSSVNFLDVRYDNKGYLDNAKNRMQIDFNITNTRSTKNQLKINLFELSQTDKQSVKNILWTSDMSKLNKKDLTAITSIVYGNIKSKLNDNNQNMQKIITLGGNNIQLENSIKLKFENFRITTENELQTRTGDKIKNAMFIFDGDKLRCVNYRRENVDGTKNIYDARHFGKPVIREEKSFVDNANDKMTQGIASLNNLSSRIKAEVIGERSKNTELISRGSLQETKTPRGIFARILNLFTSLPHNINKALTGAIKQVDKICNATLAVPTYGLIAIGKLFVKKPVDIDYSNLNTNIMHEDMQKLSAIQRERYGVDKFSPRIVNFADAKYLTEINAMPKEERLYRMVVDIKSNYETLRNEYSRNVNVKAFYDTFDDLAREFYTSGETDKKSYNKNFESMFKELNALKNRGVNIGSINSDELKPENREKFLMYRTLHNTRNLLEREAPSFNELAKNNFMVNGVKYERMPDLASRYHKGEARGCENIKLVSSDGRFELVYNYKGELLNQNNDPRSMGSYNYGPASDFKTSRYHNPADTNPYKYLGNAEGGLGIRTNIEDTRMRANHTAQCLNPITWMRHIVNMVREIEIPVTRLAGYWLRDNIWRRD